MWLSDISVRRPPGGGGHQRPAHRVRPGGLFQQTHRAGDAGCADPVRLITTTYEGRPRGDGEPGHQAHRGSALRHQRHQEHQLGDPQGAPPSRWSSSSAGTCWRAPPTCVTPSPGQTGLPDGADEPMVTKDSSSGMWPSGSTQQHPDGPYRHDGLRQSHAGGPL